MLVNIISKTPNDEGVYEYYEQVDDTNLDPATWEINPDTSAVQDIDQKLWKYNGSNVIGTSVDSDLRINDFLPERSDNPILSLDFSLIGLNAEPWQFSRGARTLRKYTDDDGTVVVCDEYSYAMTNDGRDVSDITRTVKWFNGDGSIGATKDVTTAITPKKLKEYNRTFRQGRIDYLEASAEELRDAADLVPEPYKSQYQGIADSIDLLFDHYAEQVVKYISRGTMDFENAILSEVDPTILYIHQIPAAPPSAIWPNGLTVKDTLLYQLRGYL